MLGVSRREFITLLGTAGTAWPLVARSRGPCPPIHTASLESIPQTNLPAFREGLIETGFVEGRNVAIEYRWAQGRW